MSGRCASAFGNRSGRLPGTNSRLRRGCRRSSIAGGQLSQICAGPAHRSTHETAHECVVAAHLDRLSRHAA
jgi:hypothetical protein